MTKNKTKSFGVTYWITLGILIILFINVPNFLFILGKYNYEKKNPTTAYKLLKNAHFLKPKSPNIRYFYVKTMAELKPIEQIQVETYKIAQSQNNDAAQKFAQLQVDYWKSNILRNIGDNYIEQAPFDRNLIRWDVDTFPLSVRIDTPTDVPNYYHEEIEKAFVEWAKRTDFLDFEISYEDKADIIVKFEPLPDDICSEGNCKYVVAYTNPDVKGNLLRSMTITMYDKDANGNYFSDKELYNTILHEIGHALGIMGHSYSSDDLMFMSTIPEFNITRYRSSFQYLSQDDINTIKLLYKLIPNISNTPMSKFDKEGLIYAPIVLGNEKDIAKRKINEALTYIQNAPNLPGGYIDLGVAYADLGKSTEAVNAFREGLSKAQTDNDKYIIYYNIAIVHLNSNKLDEAERYVNLARDIENTEELLELMTNIQHARSTKQKPFKEQIAR